MPDDKTKVGQPDRSRVSADQDYEVQQFAEKHGLTPRQVRDLPVTGTAVRSWKKQRNNSAPPAQSTEAKATMR